MKVRSLLALPLAVALATAAFSQPASVSQPAPGQTSAPEPYGPLTFNLEEGGDFYVAQDGHFVKAELVDGTIRFHLKSRPFQMGTDVQQMNLALTLKKEPEVLASPKGFKASRLAGPLQAARDPDTLLVFGGDSWADGNNDLEDGQAKAAVPLYRYRHAYAIDKVDFVRNDALKFETFRGTLYGFICVYKDHVRSNSFIMPVEFVFE